MDFDIQSLLANLANLVSPNEADAATRRTIGANNAPTQTQPAQQYSVNDTNGLSLQQAIQLRNALAQQQRQQQADALAQQKFELQKQLAQKKLQQPEDVGTRLASILGGGGSNSGAAEPADVLFRGVTPGTGTPYFSNFKAPAGYAPEAQRQAFQQAYDQRQQAMAAQKAPVQGGDVSDPQMLAQAAQLSTILEQAKVPSDVRSQILQAHYPGLKPAKELTPAQTSSLWKFNPNTRDFDPVPPELSGKGGKELQALGYRVYSDKQRGTIDELKDVDTAFQQLKSAVGDIAGKSALDLKASQFTGGNLGGPEGAVFQKASTNFTTIFDKFLGGVRGAGSPAMQEIRSKVLPSIISSGQVSDRLMSDLSDLIRTMGDSRLKSVVGGAAYNAADQDKQAAKVLATFNAERGGAKQLQAGTAGGWQVGPGGIRYRIK